jgi:hypothetical protein
MKVILKSGEKFNISKEVFSILIDNINTTNNVVIEVFRNNDESQSPYLMINMKEVAAII